LLEAYAQMQIWKHPIYPIVRYHSNNFSVIFKNEHKYILTLYDDIKYKIIIKKDNWCG